MAAETRAKSEREKGRRGASALPYRARLLIGLTAAILLGERGLAAFWPVATLIGGFLAFAWLDLAAHLPAFLHIGALAAFAGGFLWLLWRGARDFRWPRRGEVLHRLESESGLRHRPLSHLEDFQASNLIDKSAASLFAAHRRRLLAAIGALRPVALRADLAARDRFALRHLAVILAIPAFFAAADPWGASLRAALRPSFAAPATTASAMAIEAWIAPPEYTGLAPLNLDPAYVGTAPIAVPTGSALLIRIEGASGLAKLSANGASLPFVAGEGESQRVEAKLDSGDRIAVTEGFAEIAHWPIRILPDLAPAIAWQGLPQATDRGVLGFRYQGSDDYGIVDLKLIVRRDAETLEIDLPVRRGVAGDVTGQGFRDLTAHPWAGLPVEMRLVARDALGQVGSSAAIALDLPERVFVNPVARLLIEQRKRLVADGGALATRRDVARILHRVKGATDAYGGNLAAYLGMDMTARRLVAEKFAAADLPGILDLIWDIALDIEDGGASLAMRELRRLQQELADALARNAPPEEIERLMNEIQAAMNRYLDSLRQQLQRDLSEGGQLRRLSPDSLNLTQQDLNQMLEEARRMAESGARDSAQAMLDRLQRMLENLQAGMPMTMGKEGAAQQQMMNDLAELMRRQQDLLQQSFEAERGRQSGNQPGESGGEGAGNAPTGGGSGPNPLLQEGLRQDLGSLMRRFGDALGDIPSGMGEAEQAMREAIDSLNRQEFGDAADAQSRALDNLQKSLQSASDMLQRQAGLRPGQGERPPMDPFGRPASQNEDSSGGNTMDVFGTRVPDETAIERARAIFDELRRRRSDPDLPKLERDYLERLLKQF